MAAEIELKSRPPKAKRPLWRRIVRGFLIALAVPIVLVALLIGYLHTGSGQRLVRDKVVERIAQRVNGTISVGSLDFALFGDLGLKDVVIKDVDGDEVIALSSLKISPMWSSLTSGNPIIEHVALDGVNLHIVQNADGTSNLSTLFKPKPPEPPPTEPQVKKDRRIRVNDLHIATVNVTIDKPDGTRLALKDFGLEAVVDTVPTTKTAKVSVPKITASFALEKAKEGLSVAVNDIETGLELDVENGAGTAKLGQTKAAAVIQQKGVPERRVNFDLAGLVLDVQPGELTATLDNLLVGALVLQSLELTGRIDDKGLAGDQKVQVIGLRVDHQRLNELLQKDLLATDISIETGLSGPPDAVKLSTTIKTDGGVLTLGGDADISDLGLPGFDVTLTGNDIETTRLLNSDKVPPVKVERLRLGVRGAGRSLEGADLDVGLHIANVDVKEYRIDDVTLDARLDGSALRVDPLTIDAYGTRIVARGDIDIVRKLVDLSLTVDGDVGATLERLRNAGLKIKTELPKGAVALRENVINVHVTGDMEGFLEADVAIRELMLASGVISGNFRAELFRNILAGPDQKKVELRDLDGTLELTELNLRQLLALRGKKLDGLTGTLSGKVSVEDVPFKPWASYSLLVRAQPSDKVRLDIHEPILVLAARGTATKTDAYLKLSVEGRDGDKKDPILGLRAHAPLIINDDYKGIAPYRNLDVVLDMPERKVRDLLAYVPKKVLIDKKTGKPREIPDGTMYAHVEVHGTGAEPKGDIDVDVQVPMLGGKLQRVKLDGAISSDRPKVALRTDLDVWLDAAKEKAIDGQLRAELSRSPLLPGPFELSWWLDLDVLPQDLAQLPLPPEKVAGLSGKARAAIHLKGNRTDLSGDVNVNVDGFRRDDKGPFDVALGIAIKPDTTVLDVDFGSGKTTLAKIDGEVGRPGVGLLAALRDKTEGKSTIEKLGNPKLALSVVLPDQSTKAYEVLNPVLGKMPGKLGGTILVSGDLSMPMAKGGIAYHGFKTLNGGPGKAEVSIVADAATVGATIEIGDKPAAGAAPVTIAVAVPRNEIKPYLDAKKCHAQSSADQAAADKPPADQPPAPATEPAAPCAEAKLAVTAKIAAKNVDIKDLVPSYVLEKKTVEFDGRLTWTLDGHVILDPKPRFDADGTQLPPIAPESTLSGGLAIHDGVFTLPGTKRQYKDVAIRVSYDTSEVRIDAIQARESDLEKKQRKLDISGRVALANFRPGALSAQVSAKDWLLFGSDRVGPADAPEGSLSTNIKVNGDLGKPIKKIDVVVNSLEVLIPDRFLRAHQPEVSHVGDVIYLKEGMTPGKLPVPLSALEEESEDPFAEEKPKGPETGLDVTVRIPKKIHVLQDPMNLYAVGKIKIKRRGEKRNIDGKLDMVGGDLALGGKKHKLIKGFIVFDEKCPGGCMDLLFGRRETDVALRNVSKASAGDTVNIHLEGPLNARVTTISGAGSPGTLYDLLSMHNAGRPRYTSEPDAPATMTNQYPQHDNLLLLSYLSVNAPHLLFLDRIAAWSDAYDGRGTTGYGEYRHYSAEGYSEDGKFRVRGEMRPPAAGQSEGELGVDYLFSNTPQTAIGVGVNVGTRGGGGPGLFFEWSSED